MNLGNLLKQAMDLEKAMAMLYNGLENKFSFSKEISQFWSEMSGDENCHYEHIIDMHKQFGPEKLSVEADNDLCDKVCEGLRELKLSRLERVADLQDAYELATEIEDYETVAVFQFVHTMFKQDPRGAEISSLILAHLDKLAGFSDRFKSIDERRCIKAIPLS